MDSHGLSIYRGFYGGVIWGLVRGILGVWAIAHLFFVGVHFRFEECSCGLCRINMKVFSRCLLKPSCKDVQGAYISFWECCGAFIFISFGIVLSYVVFSGESHSRRSGRHVERPRST